MTEIASQTEGGEVPATSASEQTASNTNPAPTQTGESDGGSSSNAWIAGAVLGPIALLVIAGLLIYIWRIKKTDKQDPSAVPMIGHQQPAFAQGTAYYPQGDPYGNYNQPYNQSYNQQGTEYYGGAAKTQYADQGYAGTPFQPVELTGEVRPVEAPTEPARPKPYSPNGSR